MSRQKQRPFCTSRQEGARECGAWENASRGSALRAKTVPKATTTLHFTEMSRQNDNSFALCNKHARWIVVRVRSGCQRQDALDDTISNGQPKHSACSEPTSSQKRCQVCCLGTQAWDMVIEYVNTIIRCPAARVNILDNKL